MRCRALSFIAATVTAAVLLGLPAAAQAKPSIAVLGLEVKSDGASIDEQTTKVASSLTAALRKRARMPTGPYRLAPNSNKDLLELKLLSDCADEGKGCMSQIGTELKADRLLYGRIKRRKSGYQVSLDLLNVELQSMERSTSEIIPFSEATPDGVKRWARSLYNRLTGIPEQGTLVIQANVDKGTVYIDGEVKTSLSAGSARITGLSEGSHTVGIESDGYETYGGEISITGGETEDISVTLDPLSGGGGGGGGGGGRPGGASRVLFWTSLVATGVGAGAITITGLQVRGSLKDDQVEAIKALAARTPDGIQLDSNNACSDAAEYPDDALAQAVVDACDKGKSRAMLTNIFIGGTIVTALAATYFYYKGYVVPKAAADREREARRRNRKNKRPTVRLAPTLGPNQLGAGVTIEF